MKISIKKFATLKDVAFSAPAEIIGGNGVGKTTALNAVCFVFTGKTFTGEQVNENSYNRNEDPANHYNEASVEWGGHVYSRRIEPVFKTDRGGNSYIAIKCSTSLYIDGIKQENSDEFKKFDDFLMLATDSFFLKDWKEQLIIVDQLLKKHLPSDVAVFDLKRENLLLKSAKSELKDVEKQQKEKRLLLKNTVDPEILMLSESQVEEKNLILVVISKLEAEKNGNLEKIRKEHEKEMQEYNAAYSEFSAQKTVINEKIAEIEAQIFKPKLQKEIVSTISLKNQLVGLGMKKEEISNELEKIKDFEFFSSFSEFVSAKKTIFCAENLRKIEALKADTDNDTCPYTHAHSPECAKIANSEKENQIQKLATENKEILEREFENYKKAQNLLFGGENPVEILDKKTAELKEILTQEIKLKKEHEKFEAENEKIQVENEKIQSENLKEMQLFEAKRNRELINLSAKLSTLEAPEMPTINFSSDVDEKIEAEKLKLKPFLEIEAENLKIEAIIEHNEKLRANFNLELEELKIRYLNVKKRIAEIEAGIKKYSETIKAEFAKHFAGKLNIEIEVMEYILTTGEYNQTFFFKVNGKRFDAFNRANNQLNGALEVNAKIQILAGLQNLSGKSYPILIDGIEKNTTQKIENCGKDLIITRANFDEKLSFINL